MKLFLLVLSLLCSSFSLMGQNHLRTGDLNGFNIASAYSKVEDVSGLTILPSFSFNGRLDIGFSYTNSNGSGRSSKSGGPFIEYSIMKNYGRKKAVTIDFGASFIVNNSNTSTDYYVRYYHAFPSSTEAKVIPLLGLDYQFISGEKFWIYTAGVIFQLNNMFWLEADFGSVEEEFIYSIGLGLKF